MKRSILFFIAIFGVILSFVVSCQKTPTAELSVSQNEYTVQASGGSVNVSVSSNVDLTVRISAGWITQAGGPSSGGGTYSFTVAHNDGYDARTATITFSNGEQGVSETVTITQSQQDAIIPGSLEYQLFYEAQTFSLPVSANVDCSVSVSGGDWIKSLGTRGLTTKQYQFSIAENTGKTPREAVVTITSGSLKQSIKVEQLPTTHYPVTKQDWKESYKMTQEIAQKVGPITENAYKDPTTGWDTKSISEEFLKLDNIILAVPDESGKKIFIMQRDSSVIPVIMEFDELQDGYSTKSSSTQKLNSIVETRASAEDMVRRRVSPAGTGKEALILSPYQGSHKIGGEEEGNWNIDIKYIKKQLNAIGYSDDRITYLHDDQVSIEHFYGDSLAKYDIIMLATHGGLWDLARDWDTGQYLLDSEGHFIKGDPYLVFAIGEVDDLSFLDKFDDKFKSKIDKYILGGNVGLSVGVKWFEATTTKRYQNTIVIPLACHSFELDDISDYFRDNGASVYCGYNSTVFIVDVSPILNSLVGSLSRGLNFNDACDQTVKDKTWTAGFHARSNKDYSLADVFLVDPRAFDLKESFSDKQMALIWDINSTGGEYRYDVYLDDKLVVNSSQTNRGITIPLPSSGPHEWYVVSNLIEKKKVIVSYKSEVKSFDVEGPSVAVTGIRVSPSTLTLEEGQTSQLTATVYPANATNKKVIWSSNYPENVSVDENGLVTAIKRKLGVAYVTITAKTEDGGKTSTCYVTVKESSSGKVSVTGVSLGQSSAEIKVGDVLQLNATVAPSNATNKTVTWSSGNNSVATVSSSGLVLGKAEGTAKITAKTEDGGKTASVTITVKKADSGSVSVTGVSLDKSSVSLKVGESETLKATVSPSNATNKGLTWTSSMSSVATVSSDGVVTAKAAGTATITVKTDDGGKTATCSVTVTYDPGPGGEISVSQVTISPTSSNMTVGDTKQFSVTINPANATNQEVSWSSSDPSVASVDSKGMVTAKAEGKATITVTAKDGGVSSKATVTVSNKVVPVTGVTVSPTSLTMEIGDSKSLTITVNPSDATDKTYTVSSDNTGVVEIDKDNNVVAKGAGTANVTVTTTDGAQTATCKVTVNKPQMTIALDPTSLSFGEVNVGENATKTITISNTGKADVKVSGISVPTAFTIDTSTPFTIAVGKSQTVKVTFTPTDGKAYSGTITINSDADNQPTVALSGTGVKSSTPSGTAEAVDFGLPSGLLWASCNLGASKPEEDGKYYAWGETKAYGEEDKTNTNNYNYNVSLGNQSYVRSLYVAASYKWYNTETETYTKYSTDNKLILESADDAAHVILGGKWRIPTKEEWNELIENCKWTWVYTNGNGFKVESKTNGNYIFIPFSGRIFVFGGETQPIYHSLGFYWSSTADPEASRMYGYEQWAGAFVVGVDQSESKLRGMTKYDGCTIRPVMSK